MKKNVRPADHRAVVFQDGATGHAVLTRSTVRWTDENAYPLALLDVSSASHPRYTGERRLMDTAGRVERFRERYARAGRLVP